VSFTIPVPPFTQARVKKHVVRIDRPAPNPWAAVGTPVWVDAFLDRINAVGDLQAGWDGAVARAVSDAAVTCAMNFITEVMERDTPAPAVVPVNDGGLQLEWQYPALRVEVYIAPDGIVTAWLREPDQETELDYYPSARIAQALKALRPARA